MINKCYTRVKRKANLTVNTSRLSLVTRLCNVEIIKTGWIFSADKVRAIKKKKNRQLNIGLQYLPRQKLLKTSKEPGTRRASNIDENQTLMKDSSRNHYITYMHITNH